MERAPESIRAEAIRAFFDTDEQLQHIAARLGLSPNTVRKIVVKQPGIKQARERRRIVQAKRLSEEKSGTTRDFDDTLRRLRDEGKSTIQIAKELGVSVNVVTGRVSRLKLPQRPSAIRRISPEVRDHVASLVDSGLTLLTAAAETGTSKHYVGRIWAEIRRNRVEEPPMIIASPAQVALPLPSNVVPFPAPVRAVQQPAPLFRSCQMPMPQPKTCQYPLNDGEHHRWRFCDSTDMHPGSPYCHQHHKDCYRPRREIGEAAD